MKLSETSMLRLLGSGESISAVCDAAGFSREEFDRWWQRTIESRLPRVTGQTVVSVQSPVQIERDRWGIPHIYADNEADLFFGFGYAMAQDRLFQLDYLRRKGMGRLSEILGNDGLELDTIARTVGLNRIAAAELRRLSTNVRHVLQSFSNGINALIEQCGDRLPIEFDLLDYRPEPWTPVDCLAIEIEFRWYLTGRFPVIVIPELAKRTLGDGPLYEEFLLGEADDESILHAGEYMPNAAGPAQPLEPVGHVMSYPDAATGSNNWVIAGKRTATGRPLLASDPHIAFEAVSCWYEAHLCGGSFNVAGMSYVGIPAILFGRNERVAWGITNNICSLRDLYEEKTDQEHPDCFLFDGTWEPARRVVEKIKVRDERSVNKTIRFSRNGPIVNEILPREFALSSDGKGQNRPVTLKWLGAHQGGWLTALLSMDRATDIDSFRNALRPWHVPTFSLVIADVDGRIAFQTAGRMPVRKSVERGFRPGWDPEHQWQGLIPFEAMPHVVDPPRGWIASANNRLAPNDYPYPLFGCWSSGWRAKRIRQMIESREQLSLDDMRAMHQDTCSLRAAECVPALLNVLQPTKAHRAAHEQSSVDSQRSNKAIDHLMAWDFHVRADSVAATIFNVFFTGWCKAVASVRFDGQLVELMTTGCVGLAGRLLNDDKSNWFAEGDRIEQIEKVFQQTLAYLTDRFGPDMAQWTWGRLHGMPLIHVLSSRGELSTLLDHGNSGVHGDMVTVCNTGSGPDWKATTGAGYRLIADLASSPPVLLAIDAQSASGQPASSHYQDQFDEWFNGGYHEICLDRKATAESAVSNLTLVTASERHATDGQR